MSLEQIIGVVMLAFVLARMLHAQSRVMPWGEIAERWGMTLVAIIWVVGGAWLVVAS